VSIGTSNRPALTYGKVERGLENGVDPMVLWARFGDVKPKHRQRVSELLTGAGSLPLKTKTAHASEAAAKGRSVGKRIRKVERIRRRFERRVPATVTSKSNRRVARPMHALRPRLTSPAVVSRRVDARREPRRQSQTSARSNRSHGPPGDSESDSSGEGGPEPPPALPDERVERLRESGEVAGLPHASAWLEAAFTDTRPPDWRERARRVVQRELDIDAAWDESRGRP